MGDWRRRVAGRTVADPVPAEAAIRAAYRASKLAEPDLIMWADGPGDAARALAFVCSPPPQLCRTAISACVLGALMWLGLAFGLGEAGSMHEPMRGIATLGAIFALAGMALGAWWRIPLPPGLPARPPIGRTVIPAVLALVAMAAFLPALRYLGGLPHETAARVGVLALAAVIGALPGAIFGLRLKRAYSSLPAALRKLRYTASTGRDIERARWEAWAPFQRYPAGPRPQESLIALYRMAHQDAWMRERAGLAFSAPFLTNALETGTWLGQARLAPGLPRLAGAQDGLPPFLDGFDSAPRAAAVSAAQAEGAARRFADLAFHVDRLYAFEGIAIATKPATTVTLDAEGRPHSETGPAVTWTDGTQICAWHGDPIPADLLDRGMPLTAAYISREFDPVRRRVLIERFGLGRYLLEAGAQEIHRDCFGRLYRLVHRTGESIQAVRVVNHSPEPDGSFREYWLRVPPAIATAREAVAWTFGMLPEEYDPVSQS